MRNTRASGIALIAVGGLFIAITNSTHRASTLGLLVGVAIILVGIMRVVRSGKQEPPAA
jgi:uncharacterized membrane protein HdeD (DUF308 family)